MSTEIEAAKSFDEIGDLYDRHRPGYPDSLYADLIGLPCLRDESRLLEIGSGTGIATSPLARRGYSIVCLEPGPRMATMARRKLASFPGVEVVEETFEDWRGEQDRFDLVLSAQAFHWLDPELRFQKVASVLKSHGWLAVFGHFYSLADESVRKALEDTYTELAPTVEGLPRTAWYAHDGPIPDLIAASKLFEAIHVFRHPWQATLATSDHLSFMRTTSGHAILPELQRERLLAEVARVIDRFGGQIEIRYESNLFMARRIA